ncbi:FeoA family protein [Cognatilysobacter segetis]|uniref:FeoA family protein n=1 Tax=Cognatilysobacter segetis TaxID=2492394 RepID=UPI00105E3AD9|nr:FeoA family protein [Lysobacter segetis]
MRLSELDRRTGATVVAVDDASPNDSVARRLRELGFVAGERVEVVAAGPFGAEPLLVQVGYTRFALRRREAARIEVRLAETVQPARVSRVPEAAQA